MSRDRSPSYFGLIVGIFLSLTIILFMLIVASNTSNDKMEDAYESLMEDGALSLPLDKNFDITAHDSGEFTVKSAVDDNCPVKYSVGEDGEYHYDSDCLPGLPAAVKFKDGKEIEKYVKDQGWSIRSQDHRSETPRNSGVAELTKGDDRCTITTVYTGKSSWIVQSDCRGLPKLNV